MKAILVEKPGGPEMLKIKIVPKPVAQPGQVLVGVKAFGINRAELYMREGNWPEIANIIGIECVGIVEEDISGKLKRGQKVMCMMGGMGRSINGSYAEFTCVPLENVVPVNSDLSWAELAALPETFSSAWASLNWGLGIKKNQTLLIRGATSAFGIAALILAKQEGLNVIATTRNPQKETFLKMIGANQVLIDDGRLLEKTRALYPKGIDRVLELIGSTTLMNSAKMLNKKGIVCMVGLLGGNTFMDKMQPLIIWLLKKRGEKFWIPLFGGVKLTAFGSEVLGTLNFPLEKIPLQQIINDIEKKRIPSIISEIYQFEEISQAHQKMESNQANGKIVVVI